MNVEYPAVPGYKTEQPETSKAAAVKVTAKSAILRKRVLMQLAAAPKGLTPDECATRMDEIPGNIRPRFTELGIAGKIEDTGIRRPSAYGSPMAVFKLKSSEPQKELTL